MNVTPIQKDQLNSCIFQKSTSYSTNCERREYTRNLHFAMLTGRGENAVRIVFNTVEGYKEIITTIWGATEKLILLTDGLSIPAESVAYVSLD